MKPLTIAIGLAMYIAPAAAAQRRGGPGAPPTTALAGVLCYNRDNASVKTTESKTSVNGVDVPTEVVVLTGKPGARGILVPCPLGFGGDPFANYFFPVDLILAHQQAIGLTDAQRTALRTSMLDAQKAFVPTQVRIAAEVEKLQKVANATTVDDAAMLDAVDRVLALEREVKHAQVTLMVRVKNILTPQQQDMLAKLRTP